MSAPTRESVIEAFLAKAGFAGIKRSPLAGDASFRSYQRLIGKAGTMVLMNAPPEHEDVRPFIAVADYLRSIGLSAPKILTSNIADGLLLLEDFGDDTFSRVLNKDPGQTEALYKGAVDVLGQLHTSSPPPDLPVEGTKNWPLKAYDAALLFEELFLFCDWYLPALLDVENPAWKKELEAIWRPLFKKLAGPPPCLTLRDYHADNLMWLPDRPKAARVGLLDFQDAVIGHPAYDLVSLLQDARRPFDPALEAKMISYYLNCFGQGYDQDDFMTAYEILGAQRNMKIIGIFTRLWKRDGKAEYPGMIPHVLTLLEKNLEHPALGAAREWIDGCVPKASRREPL